jgi:hypothetical protein
MSPGLPFPVHLHWLPVNASWLDQIEDPRPGVDRALPRTA